MAKGSRNMKVTQTVVLMALLCMCVVVAEGSDEVALPGVWTSCFYEETPIDQDSVFGWIYDSINGWQYYAKAYTNDQFFPPYYNVLRWGHSSLQQPRVQIDTCCWYTFYAKRLMGGQWHYSDWSTPAYYLHPTTSISRQLDLSRTTSPGNPNWGDPN
jgi:hypothetical protein